MRYIFLICCLSFSLQAVNAQSSDIGQFGFMVYNDNNTMPVTEISIGEAALLKFSIKNMATGGQDIPANSVQSVISFPTASGNIRPYVYNGPASFSSGFFTWTYSFVDDVLIGVNTMAIPASSGDMDVLVKVAGNEAGVASSTLNITQGMGIADDISNNYSSARFTVASTPQPVANLEFSGAPFKCDVLLNWKSASEVNLDYYDVEYCADGLSFSRIARVQGRGALTGAAYNQTFTQINGDGYYRLKMVDRNGRSFFSNVVKVTTSCPSQGIVTVFPNPVRYYQKVLVNISGYTGKFTGELFDASGKRLGVYNFSGGTNELNVSKLSAGMYFLDVVLAGNEVVVKTFKIVVTR